MYCYVTILFFIIESIVLLLILFNNSIVGLQPFHSPIWIFIRVQLKIKTLSDGKLTTIITTIFGRYRHSYRFIYYLASLSNKRLQLEHKL